MNKSEVIRVLLIEDNPGDARLIQEMLVDSAGVRFDIQCADRLSTGLKYLAEGSRESDETVPDSNSSNSAIRNPQSAFDMVLLDLSLPDSEGLDTFIQTHALAPDVPIIVLTGLQDRALGIAAVREGAQDHLVKGQVDEAILMQSIHYAIERNRLLVDLRQKSRDLELCRKSFHSIVEKNADGMLIVDLKGIVQFINSVALFQFRKKREDLLGQQLGLSIVSGEVTDVAILRADKTNGFAEMRVVDTDWEGKPACLAMLRDISDRKRAEELLIHQEKLEAMGALASTVSHEIRGPLSVIKNSSEFLKVRLGKSLDEKVSRHLKILKEEVNTADKIIDDILGFDRINELTLIQVDIGAILEATIRRVSVPDNVEIVFRLGANIPPVFIDVSQIERVFLNIINNSLEAMCDGGALTIATRADSPGEAGHGLVEISFKDTGIGIPQDNFGRIYEPLFTTKSKGTGLGLATCQNIIRAHKGEIQVESDIGKGTKVTVKLPAQGLMIED